MEVVIEKINYLAPGCANMGVADMRFPDIIVCLNRFQCRGLGECLVAGIRRRGSNQPESARGNEALATGMR